MDYPWKVLCHQFEFCGCPSIAPTSSFSCSNCSGKLLEAWQPIFFITTHWQRHLNLMCVVLPTLRDFPSSYSPSGFQCCFHSAVISSSVKAGHSDASWTKLLIDFQNHWRTNSNAASTGWISYFVFWNQDASWPLQQTHALFQMLEAQLHHEQPTYEILPSKETRGRRRERHLGAARTKVATWNQVGWWAARTDLDWKMPPLVHPCVCSPFLSMSTLRTRNEKRNTDRTKW